MPAYSHKEVQSMIWRAYLDPAVDVFRCHQMSAGPRSSRAPLHRRTYAIRSTLVFSAALVLSSARPPSASQARELPENMSGRTAIMVPPLLTLPPVPHVEPLSLHTRDVLGGDALMVLTSPHRRSARRSQNRYGEEEEGGHQALAGGGPAAESGLQLLGLGRRRWCGRPVVWGRPT